MMVTFNVMFNWKSYAFNLMFLLQVCIMTTLMISSLIFFSVLQVVNAHKMKKNPTGDE